MKRLTKQAAALRRIQKLASVAKLVKYSRAMEKMAEPNPGRARSYNPAWDHIAGAGVSAALEAAKPMGGVGSMMMPVIAEAYGAPTYVVDNAMSGGLGPVSAAIEIGDKFATDAYGGAQRAVRRLQKANKPHYSPGWQHYAGLAASGLLEAAKPMGGVGKALVPAALSAYGAPDYIVQNSAYPGLGPVYGAGVLGHRILTDMNGGAKSLKAAPQAPKAPAPVKPKGRNLLKKKSGGYKQARTWAEYLSQKLIGSTGGNPVKAPPTPNKPAPPVPNSTKYNRAGSFPRAVPPKPMP